MANGKELLNDMIKRGTAKLGACRPWLLRLLAVLFATVHAATPWAVGMVGVITDERKQPATFSEQANFYFCFPFVSFCLSFLYLHHLGNNATQLMTQYHVVQELNRHTNIHLLKTRAGMEVRVACIVFGSLGMCSVGSVGRRSERVRTLSGRT